MVILQYDLNCLSLKWDRGNTFKVLCSECTEYWVGGLQASMLSTPDRQGASYMQWTGLGGTMDVTAETCGLELCAGM